MAGLTKEQKAGKDFYLAAYDPAPETEWKDLAPEVQEHWIESAKASKHAAETAETEGPDAADKTRNPSGITPAESAGLAKPAPWSHPPLSAFKAGSIEIETPVPNRYIITGFQAGTVYVPDVGHLAAPTQVDLPMTDDLAAALSAVILDFRAGKEAVNG